MYKCTECGTVFTNPKPYYETHGFQYPPFIEWDGCPFCASAGIEIYCGSEECEEAEDDE